MMYPENGKCLEADNSTRHPQNS